MDTTIIAGSQKYQQNKASWNHVGVLKTNRNKSSVERWLQISNVHLPIVGKATSKKGDEVSSNSLTMLQYKIGDVCFQKVKKKRVTICMSLQNEGYVIGCFIRVKVL